MLKENVFKSDWASPPGETVADFLNEHGLTIAGFASKAGWSVPQTNALIRGQLSVTRDVATILEHIVGSTADFWLNREKQYQEDLDSIVKEFGSQWLKELPIKDMVKNGWISDSADSSKLAADCLKFFSSPNVEYWRAQYDGLLKQTAFRTSAAFDSEKGAVAAWLRKGQLMADEIQCANWDREKFRLALNDIRSLTREEFPSRFLPELQARCADCGVAVVVLRAPSGCRASGATHFLTPNKALLLLSFRYLSDDHFWFSFFHEAGHLILHGDRKLIIDGEEPSNSAEEVEANEFAANTLIPPPFQNELVSLGNNARNVIRFARKVGVSRGVVVGQMQHRKTIGPQQLNFLKYRFSW